MDVVADPPPGERGRILTLLGWILVALGALAPLRLAAALWDIHFALYCSVPGLLCAYEGVLGALAAASGWGLLRRRRWAPVALSVTAGAILALGAGSLFVVALRYLQEEGTGHDPDFALRFIVTHGAFALLNAALVIGSLIGLTTLFRPDARREFSSRFAGPVVLGAVALLSCGCWAGLHWYCWVRYVR